MYWLLEQSVFKLLKSAEASGLRPSAEQQAQFSARFFDDDDGPASRVLTIAGGTAQIAIEGVLTNAPNMMAMLFGGGNTTYAELIQAIAEAEQNPEVQNIVLAVNSPGGQFEGLFDAITALQNVTKPMTTRVGATAASAAFALAAQARGQRRHCGHSRSARR
jgi:ClpP class serine protease